MIITIIISTLAWTILTGYLANLSNLIDFRAYSPVKSAVRVNTVQDISNEKRDSNTTPKFNPKNKEKFKYHSIKKSRTLSYSMTTKAISNQSFSSVTKSSATNFTSPTKAKLMNILSHNRAKSTEGIKVLIHSKGFFQSL